METGVLIETDDPNYKLLVDASKTIGCLLSRLILGRVTPPPAAGQPATVHSPASAAAAAALLDTQAGGAGGGGDANGGWNAWDGHTLQDFESDFWLNLAEHPFLAGGNGNEM